MVQTYGRRRGEWGGGLVSVPRRSRWMGAVQAKLVVGPAGDHYEREADSVARQVMQRIGAGPELDDEDAQRTVMRLPLRRAVATDDRLRDRVGHPIGPEGGAIGADTARRIESMRGGGSALADPIRRSMESAFGADFSGVRIHEGSSAHRLNAELGARAFTTGSDIFVRAGEYRPANRSGQEMLAHELTHVVQQGGAAELDAER